MLSLIIVLLGSLQSSLSVLEKNGSGRTSAKEDSFCVDATTPLLQPLPAQGDTLEGRNMLAFKEAIQREANSRALHGNEKDKSRSEMFLIVQGFTNILVKQVTHFSLDYIQNEDYCVELISDFAYVYCGKLTTREQELTAKQWLKERLEFKQLKLKKIIISRRDGSAENLREKARKLAEDNKERMMRERPPSPKKKSRDDRRKYDAEFRKKRLNRTTLFMIYFVGGTKNDARFSEVEISSHYVDEALDSCLVFSSDKVYLYCGSAVSEDVRSWADQMAGSIAAYKIPPTVKVEIPEYESRKMKALLEPFGSKPKQERRELKKKPEGWFQRHLSKRNTT